MSALLVTRWKRYGHDRAYVSDEDGKRLGYGCLKTGEVVVDDPSLYTQVEEAVARFRADNALDTPAAADQPVVPPTPPAGINAPAAPASWPASGFAVGALAVNRWTRVGYDRVYVHGPNGARLGYGCLKTGEVKAHVEADRARVEAAVAAGKAGVSPSVLTGTTSV